MDTKGPWDYHLDFVLYTFIYKVGFFLLASELNNCLYFIISLIEKVVVVVETARIDSNLSDM